MQPKNLTTAEINDLDMLSRVFDSLCRDNSSKVYTQIFVEKTKTLVLKRIQQTIK